MEENMLLLKKIDLSLFSNKSISSKISEAFENSDTYFRRTIKGNKIIIGKKLSQVKEEELKNKLTLMGNNVLQLKRTQSRNSSSTLDSKPTMMKSISLPLLKINQQATHTLNIETTKNKITDAELNQIYENFNLLSKRNATKSNEDLTNQLKNTELKAILQLQEDTLRKKEQHNKMTINIEQHIQSKTNKPFERMLLNRISSFRSIQEIKSKTASKIENERNNNNKWKLSLRYDNDFIGKKKGYMNIGTLNKPKWAIINDQVPKIEEKVRDATIGESSEHKSFLSNPYLKENRDYDLFKKSFDDLRGLNIQGKCLLDFEFENIKLIKGKKKLVSPNINKEADQTREFVNSLSVKNIANGKTINNFRNLHLCY